MKGILKKKAALYTLTTMLICGLLAAGCARAVENTNSSRPSETGANANLPANTADETGETTDANVYPENGLSKEEKVTLKFGFWESGNGREYIDYAMEQFRKKYPNVTFDVTYSPTIKDVIKTKIAAGNDEDMFDIISPAFNSPEEKTETIQAGLFEEVTELWDRPLLDSGGKKLVELVPEGTKDFSFHVDGKYYEIPMSIMTLGLFYDKNLFEKHNWNQTPKTYDEFVALLESIKSQGIIPMAYPGVYPGYLNFAFTIKQFELADHSGKLDAFTKQYRSGALPVHTSNESKEVWSRIYDLGKKGYFPSGVAALNHTQAQMLVLQQKAAMAITGDWVGNEMKDAIPEGFRWGFMAIPFSNNPNDSIWVENYLGAGSLMIWKNKPELVKKWAKEFMLFLLTNDIQAFNNKSAGMFPIRKDFLENPDNIAQMQDAPKAVMEYNSKNNVKYGMTRKDVVLSHPKAISANKLVTDMITEVSSGKKDPMPVLEEADQLLKEAMEDR